ncbi:MAG: ribose-phosphate pyrophosphokinase [Acidobacteria bacterium]|nr:MAG: ribose-phosphate pyrophosphokinase [Acidobacteriota bacterium]REK01304.1 MAG: ribose-phosphate pyrophosphokinase [Acidobacteriota bacterium]REK14260.1 MAG: ribose-phosphate pyrophosphokinase [Acidobacteriota bacterium]REK44975.1 MAG: ribose-phosphate pyrophosphokinase [Acidobacteriota bacterium]
MSVTGDIKIFTGNAHVGLAERICRHLTCDLGLASTDRFSDGEFNFQIGENVRGTDVFIIQPTCPPTDQNLMELLVMLDTFKRASAERVTAVIPYFGYARSDKKDRPRVPIAAKLIANLIRTAGADRVLTVDLHASQIQGFFDIPVDHLFAAPVIVDYFQKNPIDDLVVVAPDTGGAERARAYAKRLDAGLVLVDKRREKANVAEVMNVVGNVKGMNCLIVDDMCDTGGTICKVAAALHNNGANEIYACFSHAVLSGNAINNLAASHIKKIIVTDTIPLRQEGEEMMEQGRIEVLSVAELLATAIKSIHDETSVSFLFI